MTPIVDIAKGAYALGLLNKASVAPSPSCYFCIPGGEGASEFVDVSGNGRNLVPDVANSGTNPFSVPGYMTSIAGTAAGCSIPAALMGGINFSTTNILGQFTLKQAAPVSNETILALGASINTTSYNGFYWSLRTTGKIELVQVVNGVTNGVTNTNELVFGDGTPHVYTFYFDASSGSFTVWCDTVLSADFPFAFASSGAHAFGANATIYNDPNGHSVGLRVGGPCSYQDTTVPVSITNLQLYTWTGNPPGNLGNIIQKLFVNANTPLKLSDIVLAYTKEVWAMLGQSNEAGTSTGATGFIYRCINQGNGCPINDPVWPASVASGNFTAKISAGLGAQNRWIQWINKAIGSTALTQFWVGSVTLYSVGIAVTPGAYVKSVSNGNLYMAIGTPGNVYTLNVDPASGVGSSGLASWTLQASVQSFEVPGYVYSSTDGTGRFDPNGKMSGIVTALVASSGYSIQGVYIQIGQGDVTAAATAAMYEAACINATTYFTNLGYDVCLGMTYDASSTDAWNTAQILPGRASAIAALTGNPKFFVGANLCSALGIIPLHQGAEPVAASPYPAMIDNAGQFIHVNPTANSQGAILVVGSWPSV